MSALRLCALLAVTFLTGVLLSTAARATITLPDPVPLADDPHVPADLRAACLGEPPFTPQQTIDACTRIIENPAASKDSRAIAFNNRGTVHWAKNETDLAMADLNRAIALFPGFAEAVMNRGVAWASAGDIDKAIKDYDRAIVIRPKYAEAFNNRGVAYQLDNKYDRAIQDYDKAIALKENYAEAFGNRGVAYVLKGDYDRAIADYDRAIAINPKLAKPWGNRGYAYLRKGDIDRAIADSQHALELDPSLTYVTSNLREAESTKAALLAQAQAAPSGKRLALVIANSIYKNSPPLPNAANDADDIAKELKKLGYTVFGHPKTDFDRSDLRSAIEEFKRKAIGADAAVVWYAGHGKLMYEEGSDVPRDWIIPVDAKINKKADVTANAIPLKDLEIAVYAAKTLRLVVVDACRDNTFYSGSRGSRGLSRPDKSPGVMIVYSTSPGDLAQDGDGRNSPFAQAFLELVRNTPKLDIRQLFGAITGRTKQLTHDEQKPEIVSGIETGDTLALGP